MQHEEIVSKQGTDKYVRYFDSRAARSEERDVMKCTLK